MVHRVEKEIIKRCSEDLNPITKGRLGQTSYTFPTLNHDHFFSPSDLALMLVLEYKNR